ncbi:HEAT repeat domain-containing protein [Acidicapsa dinghuensis]|uniref:HEAT repeat domain-containing protein n=1 Tax=Acidicapsa dinghuensis TaxID=2218256 RepID=A0ABW1EFH1_9BACT|nr:HEAT repeat domain-containing protein [Acidicapsa dinghuensis]
MNCNESHERVVLAAYGELPDDEAHALALHLAGCTECREEQEQLLALKTLAAAYLVPELDPNLMARSRTRLEEALDAIPPKRWYDRVGDWMTRTATGLQAAPVAAGLLLVAGAGLGSLGGYEFAARHMVAAQNPDDSTFKPVSISVEPKMRPISPGEVANVSGIVREPNSDLVQVTFNQVQPRQIKGSLDDPQIRQLLMVASQNGANPAVRDNSVELLADECRAGHDCNDTGTQGTGIREALMVALRYDRSSAVRAKALEGLQPYIADDMQVRDAVLETLLNDPDAKVRSAAISMLEPVEADTSVRQVLSTVALSDQNSSIRNASRLVLRRVSEIQ